MGVSVARILVVDDEKEFVLIMEKYLAESGHKVIKAHSAVEMAEKVLEEPPDLIFLDVMMPEIDGWMACKTLKDDEGYRDIPICILTVRPTTLDAITSLEEAGANWHLTKPVTKEKIIGTVEMILSGITKK